MTPVEIARTYLGTKWVHQGRSRNGLDCIGLVEVAFSDYSLPDWTDYDRNPSGGLLEKRAREALGPPVPLASMRPNDIVLMAFPRVVRHVGIVGDHPDGGLTLIHTYRSINRVCEHRIDDRWHGLIRYVHRVELSA